MPSRPPLLSEIKPSTSGIIQDPHTGDRRVAPSKRPDGTLRKEIKIRPGFTPQEDVSKFRSARQNESQSRQLPKGSVVGFIRPQEAVTQSALKGMSEAQKKNAKRKEKRKAVNKPEVPEEWDNSSDLSHQQDVSDTSVTSNPILQTQTKNNLNPGKTLFQSALKSTSLNPETTTPIQCLVPPSNPPKDFKNNIKTPPKGKNGLKLFANALQSINHNATPTDESADSIEKKARALRKKLTQAQQLKTRQEKGEILLAEQLDKISKIDELQQELETMKLTS